MADQDQMALLNGKQNVPRESKRIPLSERLTCLFFFPWVPVHWVRSPSTIGEKDISVDNRGRKRPWLTWAPAPLLGAWWSVCVRTSYSLHPDVSSRSSVRPVMLVFIPHFMQLIKSTKKKKRKEKKVTMRSCICLFYYTYELPCE